MSDLFTEVYNWLPLCHLINQKALVCTVLYIPVTSSKRGTEQPSRDHKQTKGTLCQCGYSHTLLKHTNVYLWVVPDMSPLYNSLAIAILASIPFAFHQPKLLFL